MSEINMFEAVVGDDAGVGWTIDGTTNVFYCFDDDKWFGDAITSGGAWNDLAEDEIAAIVDKNGLDPMAFKVPNREGAMVCYQEALNAMDEELRNSVHAASSPCMPSQFFEEYAAAHLQKFGETWEYDKAKEETR